MNNITDMVRAVRFVATSMIFLTAGLRTFLFVSRMLEVLKTL